MQKLSFSSGKMNHSTSFSKVKTDVGRDEKSCTLFGEITSCFLPNKNTVNKKLFFEQK